MIAPARVAAFQVLAAISAGGTDLASALDDVRARLADPRDRALVTDIVTGVQRWRGAIDHLIVTLARRPLAKLDAEIVEILRLSIYQLLHLTRVPAAAVVDDAVNLAGKAGKKSARPFVNAVLRSISRQRKALPLPTRPEDPARDRDATLTYLSTTLSHPRWLVERWLDRYGFAATEQWLQFNNSAPPLTLRANGLRTTVDALEQALRAADVDCERGRWAPAALRIGERGQGETLERLHDQFVVQDEASQLVSLLAGASPGRRLLDTCASPGGKTTALATLQPRQLVACDVRDRRIQLLRRTLVQAGAIGNAPLAATTDPVSPVHPVDIVQADLRQPLPFRPVFDCVLVDAPCSGLGTLRRDPDIKWRREPGDLASLAAAPRTMLAHAAAVVAPGGHLVYATCSSEPEENEAIAADFAARSRFVRINAAVMHAGLAPALLDADGALHTTPPQHQLEAFYGVVFQRPAGPAAPTNL